MNSSRFSRLALAIALLLSLGTGLFGGVAGVRAQTATHDLATAAPSDAVLYADLSLDTTSAQWTQASAVLSAIGATGSGDVMGSSNILGKTKDDGFEGGEAALVVTNLSTLSGVASGAAGMVGGSTGSSSGPTGSGATGILGELTRGGSATPEASGASSTTASGVSVIVKPGDMTKAWAAAQKSFSDDAVKASAKVTKSNYKGVTIKSYAGTGDATGAAIAQAGDYIVLGETAGDIQAIVDVVKGDQKPLSGDANFAKGAKALTGDHLVFGFLNGAALASGVSSDSASIGAYQDALNVLLGANHDTAFQLAATNVGIAMQTVALPLDGAAATAKGTAADLNGASKVPANTLVFINSYDLGQSALMQALGLAVVSIFSGLSSGSATPVASPTADSLYAATAGFLGFNLKSDFLDQLTGQYTFAAWAADGVASASSVGAMLASGAANPSALQMTTSGLGFLIQAVGQGKASVTTATYGTSSLSEVSVGSGSSATKIDFGVAESQFVLGVGNGAETYLTGVTSSLASTANYKAALAQLPKQYDGVTYVDAAKLAALSGSTSMMSSDGTPSAAVSSAQAAASNIKSFASVSYKQDGLAYTSSILLVAK